MHYSNKNFIFIAKRTPATISQVTLLMRGLVQQAIIGQIYDWVVSLLHNCICDHLNSVALYILPWHPIAKVVGYMCIEECLSIFCAPSGKN